MELWDILTQGICDNHRDTIIKEIKEISPWLLDNWPRGQFSNTKVELDLLTIFLSDTGFTLYTTKEEAIRISNEFKSSGLFYNIGYNWYGGNTYTVYFNYTQKDFRTLYTKWIRNKSLDKLGI